MDLAVDLAQMFGVLVALAVGGIGLWQARSASRQAGTAETAARAAQASADAAQEQAKIARQGLDRARLAEVRAVVKMLRQSSRRVVVSSYAVIDFVGRTDLSGEIGEQRWKDHSAATSEFADATGDAMGVLAEIPFHPVVLRVYAGGENVMSTLQGLWLRRLEGPDKVSAPHHAHAAQVQATFESVCAEFRLAESTWLADPTGERRVAEEIVRQTTEATGGPAPSDGSAT